MEPRTLPPSAAAMYHSLRVYYRVTYWKGKGDSMKPEEWGWHIVVVKSIPMQNDKPAAPAELLDSIYCSCKKPSNTNRCTCRQHGVHCSDVCTECRCTESESESESFYSVLLQETSAKTYLVAVAEATWKKIYT